MPDKQTIFEYLFSIAIDKLTEYVMDDFGLPLAEALDRVYNSKTFEQLQDPATDLYIQSPAYIYERLKAEII